MTISVALDMEGFDITVAPTSRPPRGVVHAVSFSRIATARADVEITLNLTAGRAEQLADEFADIAAELRRRDRNAADDLDAGRPAANAPVWIDPEDDCDADD